MSKLLDNSDGVYLGFFRNAVHATDFTLVDLLINSLVGWGIY